MLAAEKIIIPGVDEGDADEVRDGLEVASSLWRRGDVDEALKWLRRAAKAADVSGDEARSEMLYEAAVKLSAPQAEPLTEPPESEPELPPFAEHQESTWKIKSHERKVLNTGMRPTTPPDDVLAGPDRDMAPANDSTGSPSLVALGELYERTGRWAQLAEAEQPQLAEDPTTRPHGSSQFEQLDVHRPDFFEQLEALQLPWEAVIELCFNRIDTTVELAVQTSLLRSVGRVLDAKLRDPEQAFEVLITAFELDLSDERTVVDLEKVTAGMKRWPELVQRVNGWLERATEPRLQAALCLRLVGPILPWGSIRASSSSIPTTYERSVKWPRLCSNRATGGRPGCCSNKRSGTRRATPTRRRSSPSWAIC